MKILALETTEAIGTVAAMDNGKLLLELELNPRQRTAQSLAPGIQTLLAQVDWKAVNVNLIALTIGPGSFTGLRIGVTMAKTLAYATGADILGVDTLQTIAQAAPNNVSQLIAVVDAQRDEAVTRSFKREAEGWLAPIDNQRLIAVDQWLRELTPGTVVTGPALGKLVSRLPAHVIVLEGKYWSPRAAMVARLADHLYAVGRRDDLWSLVPRYSRLSAAEEKWEAKRQSRADRGQERRNNEE